MCVCFNTHNIILLQQGLTGMIEMLVGTTQPERAPARRNMVNKHYLT